MTVCALSLGGCGNDEGGAGNGATTSTKSADTLGDRALTGDAVKVKAAAVATQTQGTARVVVTTTVEGDEAPMATVVKGDAALDEPKTVGTLAISEGGSSEEPLPLAASADAAYLKGPNGWGMSEGLSGSAPGLQVFFPLEYVRGFVRSAKAVESPEAERGAEKRYRLVIDLEKWVKSLPQAEQARYHAALAAATTQAMDIWIGPDNLIRRLQTEGEVDTEDGRVNTRLVFELSDFGEPDPPQVPPRGVTAP